MAEQRVDTESNLQLLASINGRFAKREELRKKLEQMEGVKIFCYEDLDFVYQFHSEGTICQVSSGIPSKCVPEEWILAYCDHAEWTWKEEIVDRFEYVRQNAQKETWLKWTRFSQLPRIVILSMYSSEERTWRYCLVFPPPSCNLSVEVDGCLQLLGWCALPRQVQ